MPGVALAVGRGLTEVTRRYPGLRTLMALMVAALMTAAVSRVPSPDYASVWSTSGNLGAARRATSLDVTTAVHRDDGRFNVGAAADRLIGDFAITRWRRFSVALFTTAAVRSALDVPLEHYRLRNQALEIMLVDDPLTSPAAPDYLVRQDESGRANEPADRFFAHLAPGVEYRPIAKLDIGLPTGGPSLTIYRRVH